MKKYINYILHLFTQLFINIMSIHKYIFALEV